MVPSMDRHQLYRKTRTQKHCFHCCKAGLHHLRLRSSYQAPQPQNGQPVTPMFQNSHPQVQPSGGWQQETPYPANQPNTYLPSPPPTSRYGPPPMMNQPSHHLHQRQSSFPPMSQLFPTPPAMQAGSATSHRYGPQVHHPPLTPVDTLPPQPPILRSKPQDPGQAGALLSILKGTGPSPVAKSPPPTAPPSSAPQPKAPSPQQAAPLQQAPQPPPTATPPKRADRTVSNPLLSNPISLQAPPPPRGPKAHTPQRHTSQRQRASMPGRPSTTVPPPQSYAPPSRPTTTQPPHKSPPPPLRRGTPVNIDHYGAQKPQNVPTTNFDRRKSVSGERAQTLLAMFKQPSSTSGSPVTSRAVLEEAVLPTDSPNLEKQGESPSPNRNFKDFVALEKERIKKKADMAHRDRLSKKADMAHRNQSSPEMENKKPAVPPPARLGTPSGGRIQKAKSPVGKDRAGLLAYLEDVANQGEVFPFVEGWVMPRIQ
ncbi:hypothetical protein BDD12DRAFT_444861 [Trichophaea hybrida]|nr:hypothetical protein BDD12DRAFT_444861 [Trichophaea hybrida]